MNAEFLPGLPGVGPEPVHCFMKDATPWSEGSVVKFSGLARPDWVANLQTGWGYASQIVEWPAASGAVVIAKGAVYLLRAETPNQWRFYDPYGIQCVLAPGGRNAVIATYHDLMQLDANGDVSWRRTLAVDGVEIHKVGDDVVCGRYCDDPPDRWLDFRLSRFDGRDV
jgi:hypothetical protein